MELFNEALTQSVKIQFLKEKDLEFNQQVEDTKKIYVDLAQVVIQTFYSIVDYTKDTYDTLNQYEADFKIIKAVSDTLIIKIETIEESTKFFLEELADFCQGSNVQLPKYISSEIYKTWQAQFENYEPRSEEISSFFDGIKFTHSYLLLPWADKYVNERQVKFDKKILELKKNHILFEISTFNELLNYSISRLKLSEEIDILMYIQVVEEANSMINTTLVSYNIRSIVPKERDIFNAKEPEVIMTERSEDYKKGEIIRVSNQGYRQNDKVIIRANVIVAR